MNKFTVLSFLLLAPVTMAQATESYFHRYGENSANTATVSTTPSTNTPKTLAQPYGTPQPVTESTTTTLVHPQPIYATPNQANYGFYGQKSVPSTKPHFLIGGNPYTLSTQTNQNSYYNTPEPIKENTPPVLSKKLYYVGLHTGLGKTFGWDHGEHNQIKPIFSLFAGTWATPSLRLDAELAYHVKGRLSRSTERQTTYKQYDLGANAYYDFSKIKFGLKPFVGGGFWFVKKTIKDSAVGENSKSSSHWRSALSASAGLTYPITDVFSLSAMVRGRYIITQESLYNIEALLGARYDF